jgi:glutamyl/glutaminyl-tRNA synthetase
MTCKRTRLAPTPSGYLHIGNVRSFLLTRQLADETGARLLLRIDDMDRARAEDKYIQDIFSTLSFLGIAYDEGPRDLSEFKDDWSQLHRLPLYVAALRKLRDTGMVFACTCSRADIARISADGSYPGTCKKKGISLDAENVCWRLDTDKEALVTVNRLNDAPIHSPLPPDIVDFVVRKKDGFPAYQLTSLVDDVHFRVDLIVRGADLWNSTLAQLYIARLLGYHSFLNATFCHHALIAGADGTKLSKSAGATSIQYLRAQGATPADIRQMAGF